MDMHDRFTWSVHVGQREEVPWQRGRARRVGRRRLAAIERALTADAPALSAKFAVFNQLTDGERPTGAERVPAPSLPRLRAVQLATLLVLAAIIAVCVTLSTQLRPAGSSCQASAAAAAAATAAGTSAPVPVHAVGCHAYPATKQ